MRTRGAYRVSNSSNGVSLKTKNIANEVNVNHFDVIDIIEEENHFPIKRLKCDNNITPEVITIDSDEEVAEYMTGDIQIIKKEVKPFTDVGVILEKVVPKVVSIKKCSNCFRFIPNQTKDYEYNRLTSADFYLNPRIHPSMISMELRDRTRFNCYEETIVKNQRVFDGKTVLIIGSATGLLALMVAKAQARNVIIFDRNGILEIIETIIEKNRFKLPSRTKFFFIRKSIEESDLPNGFNKVDIIVSDWTNHSLFYKSLIIPFIKARDKWLKKGGLIYPDSAQLYLAGAHDFIHRHTNKDKRSSDSLYVKRIDYWDKNVYGFNMTALRERVLSEPIHENVLKSQVITNEFPIKRYNLYELTVEDINFSLPFELSCLRDHYLHTFVIFFDVIFTKGQAFPVMYSTRPTAYRHMFRPTVMFIDSEKQLTLEKNDKIEGVLNYSLTPDLNQLSINIEMKLKNKYFDVNQKLEFTTY